MSHSREPIGGLKLISHNARGYEVPDDPSHPFKLVMELRPPSLMDVAQAFVVSGTEQLVIRGMTKEAIEEFLSLNGMRTHPRLRKITITGPDGLVETQEGRR